MRSLRSLSQVVPATASTRASTDQDRALSPSQAALQALGGNAIPIRNPKPVPRTVSVPKDRMRSPQLSEASSTLPDTCTLDTTDMIERFPDPPSITYGEGRGHASPCEQNDSRQQTITRQNDHRLRRADSRLQPKQSKTSASKGKSREGTITASFIMRYSGLKPTSEGRARLDDARLGTCAKTSGTRKGSPTPRKLSTVPISSNGADDWTSHTLGHVRAMGASDKVSTGTETIIANSSGLGHDHDPLHRVDAGNADSQLSDSTRNAYQTIPVISPPPSTAPLMSSRAGTYFNNSFESPAVTSLRISVAEADPPAHSKAYVYKTTPERHTTRYQSKKVSVSQVHGLDTYSNFTGAQACKNATSRTVQSNDENILRIIPPTLIPITVTSAARSRSPIRCKHGRTLPLSAIPPLPINFDGPPPSTTSTQTNTHSRPANAGSLAQQGLLRGLTWRSRMSRVKCWRCEMESTGQKGLGLVKEMLAWTCFCRFKGYELESDSETEREEEMHRRQAGVAGQGLRSPG